jgi:hypothetical protein
MKKLATILTFLLIIIFTVSCKRCKTCTCWKDGVSKDLENCAYGGGSSNKTLETWESYLRENSGYDSVKCVTK